MTIAVDATHFTGVSGIETYARNLVRAFATQFPSDRIVLVTTRGKAADVGAIVRDLPNVRVDARLLHPLALGRQSAGFVHWLRQRAWRRVARSCDAVHFPDPLHYVDGIPHAVVTVHDIIPAYPESWAESPTSRSQVELLRRIARGAARIIVPSNFVKHELARAFQIDAARIHVVYEAANARFTPVARDRRTLERSGIEASNEFFLCVGRLDPRKNLERTIEAFAKMAHQSPDLRLVIAGHGRDEIVSTLSERAAANGVGDRVLFLSGASDDDLIQLYSGAIALVFVSLSEGFGLPAIEAMQCGCPVIASNTSSLAEIVGDAGTRVDPLDVVAIADAMRTLAGDAAARASLRAAGIAHASDFTWERAARESRMAFESARH